jgi:hypothetical protein
MQARRLILYLIFVVTVIYGVYFHFLSGRDPETSVKNELESESATYTIDSPGNRHTESLSKEDSKDTVTLEWERDPFRYDGGIDDKTAKNNFSNRQSSSKP